MLATRFVDLTPLTALVITLVVVFLLTYWAVTTVLRAIRILAARDAAELTESLGVVTRNQSRLTETVERMNTTLDQLAVRIDGSHSPPA
jgi:hypothetical protein